MSTPEGPRLGARFSSPSDTVLTRSPLQKSDSNTLQNQVDTLVSVFIDQATDLNTLASLTAGGLAYRYGKIGVMGLGSSVIHRPLSVAVGLGSEVTAFEFTNRTLHTLRATTWGSPLQNPSPVTPHLSPSLWSWSGPGGWMQSLIADLITFGALKGAGHLTRESNVVLRHSFASTAMVAGHQTSAQFGIIPKPEGSLAEQFLHAEVTNIQLGAGASLVHAMAPGISGLERGLDLSLQYQVRVHGRAPLQMGPQWAWAVGAGFKPTRSHENHPHILLMAAKDKNLLVSSLKGTITFDRGALAVGGENALQWLESIRESSSKGKTLFWIPDEFHQTILLNEFDLVMSYDRKDLIPINTTEKIPITALPPLLPPNTIVRMPKNYHEEVQKLLKRWEDRFKMKQEGLYDWKWLNNEFRKLFAPKEGVKEIKKEGGKRWIFFQNGKKELLPPNVIFHPDLKTKPFLSHEKALTHFENQFWGFSPQEMVSRVGEKVIRKIPERTIVTQFLLPGSMILPTYGQPLQGIKGLLFFFYQYPHSWMTDFSSTQPIDVTKNVSPHILEYLQIISGTPAPRSNLSPRAQTPNPTGEGIPKTIEEQNALPMIDSRPVPSPGKPPSAEGKPGRGRIETDPTQPLKNEDLQAVLEEARSLPFAKTNPEGQAKISSLHPFHFLWKNRIYRAVQRLFTRIQIKWMEFRIERIFKAGQTPSTDLVLRLNHLREKAQFLQKPNQELPGNDTKDP